jgi:MFS family permease
MSIWRNRDFVRLWTGQSVSMLGSQMTGFAVPVLAITVLGADAGQLSLLRTLEFLPFVLLTLPVGLWVDRNPPRPAMVAANAARGVLIAAVAVAGLAGLLHLGWLAAALLAIGACTVVFDVAYLSYLPAVVPRERLVDGNSALSVSASAADVGGPGIAGGLVQVLGAPVVLLIDAASFAASVVTLRSIGTADSAPSAAGAPVGLRRQVRDGVAAVLRDPYLRTISLEAFTYNLFAQFGETLIALYALSRLGLGAGTLGLCVSLGSVGALAGAVLAPRVVRRFGFGPTFVAGTALGCGAPLLVPLSGGPVSIAVSYLVTGFGVTISVIGSVTLRQAVTPAHLLGRVNAVMRLASYTAIPVGSLAAGLLATTVGLRAALFVGAAGLLLPVLVLLFSPVPKLRDPLDAGAVRH